MSDYDYRNPEDPFQRDTAYDPNVRTGNSAWGWDCGRRIRGDRLSGCVRHGAPAWAEWNQYRFQRDAGARDNADEAAGHQSFAGKSGAASHAGAK